MTEEAQADEVQTEQQEEDAALENMEATLKDMRGDDSYDDVDQDTDDQQEEANEEESGEDQSTESDQAHDGEETSAEGEAAAEPEGVQGEEGAESPDADGSGEVDNEVADDKLAASMNEKTAERFTHFREENKRLNDEYETQGQEYTQLKESTEMMNHYINDSQINPEQLSAALSLAKAINTGDMEQARAAFPRMQEMMNHVAIGLGDPSAHVDMRPQLQESVDNLDITPDLARQQALNDSQQYQRQQYQNHQYQQQQQQQAVQNNAQQAASDIQQWENGMVAGDPDFSAKRTQMLQSSESIMQNFPPEQWLPRLQEQYGTITQTMNTMAAQRTREMAKQNQATRPNATSGRGAVDTAPKSLDDLIKRDLNRMRGVG